MCEIIPFPRKRDKVDIAADEMVADGLLDPKYRDQVVAEYRKWSNQTCWVTPSVDRNPLGPHDYEFIMKEGEWVHTGNARKRKLGDPVLCFPFLL